MSKVTVKSIDDLLKYKFFIPAYQRGYKWTERQVEDLLNDIEKFTPEEIDNSTDKTWYCLQPVVVKWKEVKNKLSFFEGLNDIMNGNDEQEAIIKTKDLIRELEDFQEWEVIDGQQRLTTIFLILTYLSYQKFNIKFDTRNDQFLNEVSSLLEKYELNGEIHIDGKAVSNHYNEFVKSHGNYDNIDNFHIFRAYLIIKRWFETHEKDEFREKFLKHVKVIWYETQDDDAIGIFTRINMGKIPLTNAELIKALFLNSSNLKDDDPDKLQQKQREIASEWDRMEYALQDDAFWYFLNEKENSLATRIEFIFDLMYSLTDKKFGSDEYATFHYFSEKFKDNSNYNTVENNWEEIKNYYQTLEEWFTDRELYHKIGFLITSGVDIKDILANSSKTKRDFKQYLDQKIKYEVNVQVKNLEYRKYSNVKTVLLLHNIITTLRSDDTSLRFPFDKYKDKKKGGWSIEHIHAQSSKEITEIEDFKNWLQSIDEGLISEKVKNQIVAFEENPDEKKIPDLVESISALFGETEVHSIDNLALLSKSDNSKLNNGLFPIKRARIIELEKEGAYIPICTKKVFQKYYDGCTKQITKWEEKDRGSYLDDIETTLKKYLPEQNQSNDAV